MNITVYEKPREKLARKGAVALTNAELLQVIIGSGNAQAPVAKIAKKVAKVLAKSGSAVHPQELLVIHGVGKVKAGQILALFELAARFPVLSKGEVYDSAMSLKALYQELIKAAQQTIVYVTFDGAGRLLSKRQFILESQASVSKQVRKVFTDCISDSATSLFIAIGWAQQTLEPGLFELNIIRDTRKTAQLLSIPIRSLVLVSAEGEYVIKEAAL